MAILNPIWSTVPPSSLPHLILRMKQYHNDCFELGEQRFVKLVQNVLSRNNFSLRFLTNFYLWFYIIDFVSMLDKTRLKLVHNHLLGFRKEEETWINKTKGTLVPGREPWAQLLKLTLIKIYWAFPRLGPQGGVPQPWSPNYTHTHTHTPCIPPCCVREP